MKYVITNKSTCSGTIGDDADNQTAYMELGFELTQCRIKSIKMLIDKELSADDDFIVTIEDRKFLYSKLFKNVITYKDFVAIEKQSTDQVIDLVDIVYNLGSAMYKGLCSKYLDVVLQVDYSNLDNFKTDEKFICMLVRARSHCSQRSCDVNYSKSLLKGFVDKGFLVYVGGQGVADFCDGNRIVYAPKLQDWSSLIHHDNCYFLTGPTSGASGGIGQLCCKSKMLMMDPDCISNIAGCFGKNPLYFAKNLNFTDVPTRFYTTNPSLQQLLNDAEHYNIRYGRE